MNSSIASGGLYGVFRLVVVLLFGGQEPADVSTVPQDMKQYSGHEVQACLQIDIDEFRSADGVVTSLRKAYINTSAYEDAADKLGELGGMNPLDLKKLTTGVRNIGVSLLGVGDDIDCLRYIVVMERESTRDVLPPIMEALKTKLASLKKNQGRRDLYREDVYAGKKIYGFNVGQMSYWFAEVDGVVGMGSDKFAVQSFIMGAMQKSSKAKTSGAVKRPGVIAHAEGNCAALLNEFLTLMDSDDRDEEMAMISAFLDFSAWQKFDVALTKGGIKIDVGINSFSRLCKVLPSSDAGPTPLLNCFPPKCAMGLIVAPKDPNELWLLIKNAVETIMTMDGDQQAKGMIEREFKEEVGLDVNVDVVDILSGAGMIIPTVKPGLRNFENGLVIVGQTKSAVKAAKSITTLAHKITGEALAPIGGAKGEKIWNVDGVKMALLKNTLLFGPDDGSLPNFDSVLNETRGGASKLGALMAKRYPEATVYGMIDPSVFLRGEKRTGLVTAGLTFKDGLLTLKADVDSAQLEIYLNDLASAEDLKSKQTAGGKKLAVISTACKVYLNNYGKYPGKMTDIEKHIKQDLSNLTSPFSGKSYLYNRNLSGMQIGTVADRSKAVLAYDDPSTAKNGGQVIYLSGYVEWFDSAGLNKIADNIKSGKMK